MHTAPNPNAPARLHTLALYALARVALRAARVTADFRDYRPSAGRAAIALHRAALRAHAAERLQAARAWRTVARENPAGSVGRIATISAAGAYAWARMLARTARGTRSAWAVRMLAR